MAEKSYAGLSFEQVIRAYADTVTRVCVIRLQSFTDAEDCFQNTFLKLYCTKRAFNDRDHLKAWLIRVAVNECNDCLRKRSRLVPLETAKEIPVHMKDDPSDASWALMKLEEPYREVLYLYYCEEYKVREIAEILEKNTNTVKTILMRGREKLKRILGGENNE